MRKKNLKIHHTNLFDAIKYEEYQSICECGDPLQNCEREKQN